jgi:DNA-nicking Smr family endonuclease
MGKTGWHTAQRAGDAALWRAAMHGVAPLPGRKPTAPTKLPEPGPLPAVPLSRKPSPPAKPPLDPPLPPLAREAGIDRASAQRLRRGTYPVEARLDLHGMTQAEAHRALSDFIVLSRAIGTRCVLVITGHGRNAEAGRTGGGVLKNAVPRWLDEPGLRHQLLARAPARPRDGGGGAFYLLLKKPRSATIA